ncbi:MAG TPA: YfiR/HmsC family protein [Polyangiaceae bacterium]|nr:YfiR/HmsC family protein [Polyangiaceae bacterium]
MSPVRSRPRETPKGLSRRAFLVLGGAIGLFLSSRTLNAQSGGVPAGLQAELLAKLVSYDRNFKDRAGDRVRTVVVVRKDQAQSKLSGAAMKLALSELEQIGGLPHEETLMEYQNAAALAAACRANRIALVYLTPGLSSEVPAIREALAGVDVLSVSAEPLDVKEGIVLGFELESGKPKILLNLPQSRRQNVQFRAEAMKLMEVYR